MQKKKGKRKYHQHSRSTWWPVIVAALHDHASKFVRLSSLSSHATCVCIAFIVRWVLCTLCMRTQSTSCCLFCLNCKWKFASLVNVTHTCCWAFLALMNKWCKSALSFRSGMKREINRLRLLHSGGVTTRRADRSRQRLPECASDAAKWKQMSNVSPLRKWWIQRHPVSFQSGWVISSSHRAN